MRGSDRPNPAIQCDARERDGIDRSTTGDTTSDVGVRIRGTIDSGDRRWSIVFPPVLAPGADPFTALDQFGGTDSLLCLALGRREETVPRCFLLCAIFAPSDKITSFWWRNSLKSSGGSLLVRIVERISSTTLVSP